MSFLERVINKLVGCWASWGSRRQELPRDQFPPQPPPSPGGNYRPGPVNPPSSPNVPPV